MGNLYSSSPSGCRPRGRLIITHGGGNEDADAIVLHVEENQRTEGARLPLQARRRRVMIDCCRTGQGRRPPAKTNLTVESIRSVSTAEKQAGSFEHGMIQSSLRHIRFCDRRKCNADLCQSGARWAQQAETKSVVCGVACGRK